MKYGAKNKSAKQNPSPTHHHQSQSPKTAMPPKPKQSSSPGSDPESYNEINESTEQTSWTKTQHLISTNLLPLVSQQKDLYSLLHNGDLTKKEELAATCRQLFRYVEYLAELQEKLRGRTEESHGELLVNLIFERVMFSSEWINRHITLTCLYNCFIFKFTSKFFI